MTLTKLGHCYLQGQLRVMAPRPHLSWAGTVLGVECALEAWWWPSLASLQPDGLRVGTVETSTPNTGLQRKPRTRWSHQVWVGPRRTELYSDSDDGTEFSGGDILPGDQVHAHPRWWKPGTQFQHITQGLVGDLLW